MRCFCKGCGGSQCFCRLKFVVYKLKCTECKQTYVGKTVRELWIRVAEHMRSVAAQKNRNDGQIISNIKNKKVSSLALHKCKKQRYELRILARAEYRKEALRIIEGKMIQKYKPEINRKQEKKAQKDMEKMGESLRSKGTFERDTLKNSGEEEASSEFWIESSDFRSNELVECEDEEGDGSTETEASEVLPSEPVVEFNRENYEFLAKIAANKSDKPFVDEGEV